MGYATPQHLAALRRLGPSPVHRRSFAPVARAAARLAAMVSLRSQPEDFRVDEIPLYAPSGEGEHTFVRVEKRLRTTEEVARELARAAGVRPAEVGYAGRKDRDAVTTQWFSVQGLAPEAALALELPGLRVIEARRHPHKLRTGQLRGNRFEIVVRDVGPEALRAARGPLRAPPARRNAESLRPAALRLGRREPRAGAASAARRADRRRSASRALPALGAPGRRLQRGARRAAPAAGRARARRRRRGARVGAGCSGSRTSRARRRAPRPSRSARPARSSARACWRRRAPRRIASARRSRRSASIRRSCAPPPGIRLRGARRALRVRLEAADAVAEGDALRLRFTLPAGSYASVALEELFGPETRIG